MTFQDTGRKKEESGMEKTDRYLSEERYEESDDKQSFGSWKRRKKVSGHQAPVINKDVPDFKKEAYANLVQTKRKKKKPETKRKNKIRVIRVGKNAKKSMKSVKALSDNVTDDTGYDGRPVTDDTEYTGGAKNNNGKNAAENAEEIVRGGIKALGVQVLLLVKLIFSAMSKIAVIAVAVIAFAAITILPAIEDATYDFVADEKVYIREIMSQVTAKLSEEIKRQQNVQGCSVVITTGELTDWKNVIAFWWTVTRNLDGDENFYGSSYEDIKHIFYQFNHIEYAVTSGDDKNVNKTLNVIITNSTFEDVSADWMLSDGEKLYYEAMLADDEIWEDVLGTTELSRIAFKEIGNSMDKYREWYGSESDDISGEFTLWCMNEAGLIMDSFITKSDSSQALMQQLNNKGFLHYANEKGEKEGDMIFLQINGQIVSGIITRMDEDTMYVTMNGFTDHIIVEEQTFNKSSGLIKAYAHINGFFVDALLNAGYGASVSGNGELLWPVAGGYYQVTSAYGRRESPGGVGSTNHMGIDIAAAYGTPVVACAAGTVTAASYTGSMGNYVKINHHNGLTTIYMHNSSLKVVVGQEVNSGDVIALAGSTGNSTGTHCHLGVIKEDVGYVDLAPYLGIPEGFKGNAEAYINGSAD